MLHQKHPLGHWFASPPFAQLIGKKQTSDFINFTVGLVLFTGKETKIVLNTSKTPSKRTRIEKEMNPQIGFIFLFQVLLSAGLTIAYSVLLEKNFLLSNSFPQDAQHTMTPALNSFLTFWFGRFPLQFP